MKKINLTFNIEIGVLGLDDDNALNSTSGILSELEHATMDWNDGRLPFSVELAHMALTDVIENAIRVAILHDEDQRPQPPLPNPMPNSWTNPANINAEKRCSQLHVVTPNQLRILEIKVE